MRRVWWYLAGGGAALLLTVAALALDAAAHPDGCHRWHSCPSDDNSYVCGDRGHCSECADNQYCLNRRPRGAAATATRPPRPTRTPEPPDTPRPTRTPDTARPTRTPEASAAVRGDTPADAPRAIGASGATGLPLGASSSGLPGTSAGAPPAPSGRPPAGQPARADAPATVEWAGVRVVGPIQWTIEAERPALAGIVHNGGTEPQTLVLVLLLLDEQAEPLGAVEVLLADLLPGESRSFVHALPLLARPPADVRARLEPLVP